MSKGPRLFFVFVEYRSESLDWDRFVGPSGEGFSSMPGAFTLKVALDLAHHYTQKGWGWSQEATVMPIGREKEAGG